LLKENVIKAYQYAKEAHKDQTRKFSGLPYFSHPKGVARIVKECCEIEHMIIAALLHDVVEDTNITMEDIIEEFGSGIASIVEELTSDSVKQKEQGKKHYLLNKIVNMSKEARIIKLADRLHNILYLQGDIVPLTFVKNKRYSRGRDRVISNRSYTYREDKSCVGFFTD